MTKIITVKPKPIPMKAFQFTKQTTLDNLPEGFHAEIRAPGGKNATLILARGGRYRLGTWFVNTGNKSVWRSVSDSTMRKLYDFEGDIPPMYDLEADPTTQEHALWV